MAVDIRRFGWIRPLARDYAYRYEALADFYAGDPSSPEAWRSAIARTQAHPRARREIAGVLAAQQERRGTPDAARAAAATLQDPRTIAIVTGQQAGLFGGPLFTLLKALTAVRLAEQVAREHAVPAVPLFWIDAEDHDWDEVAACHVLTAEHRRATVAVRKAEALGEVPVAAVRLDEGIASTIDRLEALLARTEFTGDLLRQLRHAYEPGTGMAHAFGRFLETLLGPKGLVVFDASDPLAKPLAADVFARELSHPGRTALAAGEAGAQLSARGYHAQVVPQRDSASLFLLNGARHPLRRAGDGYEVEDRTVSVDRMVTQAARSPERFSPNVLLRPIVQDTLFPTACYVAGPSELAYLGQLREVYAQFDVPMPLITPRASATLLDSAAARFLSRYELALESLQPQNEATLNRLLEAQLPPTVESTLQKAAHAVKDSLHAVIDAVPAIDPTLQGAARSTLGRMEHDLQTLHGKIIQAAKRRDETLRRQFVRAQAQAFPEGQPQERAVGMVHFLNQYGPALVDVLNAELPLETGRHWVLTL